MRSLIIAFATYSKIPMPKVEWDERSTRYSLCFFPFVGMVIGGCYVFLLNMRTLFQFGNILTAAVLTVLPILITGGIHMDGFLDTVDARSSYRSQEERLKILDDPHTGAFANIFGLVYILLYFAFMHELVSSYMDIKGSVFCIALGFVYVRVLSGLSVTIFRKAKEHGMAATMAKTAGGCVKWVLGGETILCIAGFLLLNPLYGSVCVLTGLLCFIGCRSMAYKCFGGITGDVAGYFLQLCELLMLMAMVIVRQLFTYFI